MAPAASRDCRRSQQWQSLISGDRPAFKAQDLDARRSGQHLAEGVHPITGFLNRADPAIAELIELIETRQLDLELQCRTVAVTAGQRHQQPRIEALAACRFDFTPDELDRPLTIDRPYVIRKAPKYIAALRVVWRQEAIPTPFLSSTRRGARCSINETLSEPKMLMFMLAAVRPGLISIVNDLIRGKSC